MASIFSVATFHSEEEGADYLLPCTKRSLQEGVSKLAWNTLCDVDCVKYPKYKSDYANGTPFELMGVVILIRATDGVVLDKYPHYNGYSEWGALKEICKRHFKRGKKAEDFKILFMTEGEYKSCSELKFIKNDTYLCFNVQWTF